MSNLFNRKAEIVVDGKRWFYPELNFEYDVKFDWDSTPDLAEFKLYNLSRDSISKLRIGRGIRCTTGYAIEKYYNDTGTIFNGKIYDVYVKKDGVDIVTEVKAINALGSYTSKRINKTFGAGVKASYIIKYLFEYISVPYNYFELKADKTFQKGYTATGLALDRIKDLAKLCGSKLVIRNNSFMIMPDKKGIETGFLLSPETGLLDVERMDKQRNGAQFKIKMLLNHAISSKSLLKIKSTGLQGTMMVLEGRHKDWITEVEVVPVG